jgi:hypothetical protein
MSGSGEKFPVPGNFMHERKRFGSKEKLSITVNFVHERKLFGSE